MRNLNLYYFHLRIYHPHLSFTYSTAFLYTSIALSVSPASKWTFPSIMKVLSCLFIRRAMFRCSSAWQKQKIKTIISPENTISKILCKLAKSAHSHFWSLLWRNSKPPDCDWSPVVRKCQIIHRAWLMKQGWMKEDLIWWIQILQYYWQCKERGKSKFPKHPNWFIALPGQFNRLVGFTAKRLRTIWKCRHEVEFAEVLHECLIHF